MNEQLQGMLHSINSNIKELQKEINQLMRDIPRSPLNHKEANHIANSLDACEFYQVKATRTFQQEFRHCRDYLRRI